jgi:hypothetical protein
MLTAVSTSVLIGLLATRYDEYAFWWSWTSRAFLFGMAVFVLVYVAAGLGAIVVAGAVGSADDGAVTGVVAGAAGHAALRAQIERLGPGPDDGGRSALTLVRNWVVGLLDVHAYTSLERWVKAHSDSGLIALTFDVFWRHVDAPGAQDEVAVAQLHDLLIAAASDLQKRTGAEQADGRSRLRGFCCRELRARRVPRERI